MFYKQCSSTFVHVYNLLQKHGNACLGILNGSEVGLESVNLIGGKSLKDNLVKQIGVPPFMFNRVVFLFGICRHINA